MRYIKYFENKDILKKYFIVKDKMIDRDRYYLCNIDCYSDDDADIILNKIYTLYPNKKIRKNRHQKYSVKTKKLNELIIYQSDIFENAYKTLESIYSANEFNL